MKKDKKIASIRRKIKLHHSKTKASRNLKKFPKLFKKDLGKNLGVLTFLLVSVVLAIATVYINNPELSFDDLSQARWNPDAIIRQRERATGCVGAACMYNEIKTNIENRPGKVSEAERNVANEIDQLIISVSNPKSETRDRDLERLTKLNPGIAKQVKEAAPTVTEIETSAETEFETLYFFLIGEKLTLEQIGFIKEICSNLDVACIQGNLEELDPETLTESQLLSIGSLTDMDYSEKDFCHPRTLVSCTYGCTPSDEGGKCNSKPDSPVTNTTETTKEYCSVQRLTACAYGCDPNSTGGSCSRKEEISISTTNNNSNSAEAYCSTQRVTACAYGCTPTSTGGRCNIKPKTVVTEAPSYNQTATVRKPYCSVQRLTACAYGCTPTPTGGSCKDKPRNIPEPTITQSVVKNSYCSDKQLKACIYGCTPSTTGGTCKEKYVPTKVSEKYCSTQRLTACSYGCTPSIFGGLCNSKYGGTPTPNPTTIETISPTITATITITKTPTPTPRSAPGTYLQYAENSDWGDMKIRSTTCNTCAKFDKDGNCKKWKTNKSYNVQFGITGCGPTAVTNIANRHGGYNITPDEVYENFYEPHDWSCTGTGSAPNIEALQELGFEVVDSRGANKSLNSLYNIPENIDRDQVIFMGSNREDFGHWTTSDNWRVEDGEVKFDLHDSWFRDKDYDCTVVDTNLYSCEGHNDPSSKIKLSTSNEPIFVLDPPEEPVSELQ